MTRLGTLRSGMGQPAAVRLGPLANPSRGRPRLLYLLPSEAFGGAERQGVAHVRALPSLGIDVTAMVGPGTEIVHALQASGVADFVYFEDFPGSGDDRPAWARTVGDWLQWAKAAGRCRRGVMKVARSGRFDVVFANRPIAWPLAGMLAARCGIPYVVRAGGRPANPLTRIPLSLLRLAYPPPALFVANCEAVRAPLAPWFACPSRILSNGVDLSGYRPQDAALCRLRIGLPSDRPIVGMAARPAPEKGLGFFARVARLTALSRPDVLFALAGDHVTRSYYQRLFAKQGLSEAVRFLGHLDDVTSFYASCDVVVLTSPQRSIEGSPNALLEAMAMARPVVATRVGGVPELVRDGLDGFLAEPDDPEGFAGHVVRLLDSGALRKSMGESGRCRAAESFDASQVAKQLALIVEACAASVAGRTPVPASAKVVGCAHR